MRLQFWVQLSLLSVADFYWSCILILTPSTPQRQCLAFCALFFAHGFSVLGCKNVVHKGNA